MSVRRGDGPKAFFAALAVTVLGVIWLVGGLALGIFFVYPIILIIAGIIGMITNGIGLLRQPSLPRMPYGVPPSQPMYYSPQPMMPMAAPAGPCWQCGRPNNGQPVCAACGAPQYPQPPQQPMGPYGAAPGYPPPPGYPPAPNYPPMGYPPAPVPTPAANPWEQPSQAPQPPQQGQGW